MPQTEKAILTIDKPARSSGADRYAGKLGKEKFAIYIPQSLSRDNPPSGSAMHRRVEITITMLD